LSACQLDAGGVANKRGAAGNAGDRQFLAANWSSELLNCVVVATQRGMGGIAVAQHHSGVQRAAPGSATWEVLPRETFSP